MDELISKSTLLEKIQPVDFLFGADEAPPYSGMAVSAGDIESAPAVDAIEAIKSTEEIEQALSILNIYRNSYYTEPSGTVKYAVANAINTILPLFTKCLERRTDATN